MKLATIILSLLFSLSALAYEDPFQWIMDSRDINECFDIADDVAPIPQKENRLLRCLDHFNGTSDQRYCYKVVEKFITPRNKMIANHKCTSYQPPVERLNPIFENQLREEERRCREGNQQFPAEKFDTNNPELF